FNREDYVELLAIRDRAEYEAAARSPGSWGPSLAEFVAAGGGIRYVIIQSDDLAGDVAAMRSRGVDVSDAVDGSRETPAGQRLQWKVATLGAGNSAPIFFIQHVSPLDARRGEVAAHPNGVYTIERAYIATRDVEGTAALYAKVLGLPQPATHKGTVIMSDMAVFEIGPTGLSIAQPYAPGPAASALEKRGPGPFQALYRTTSMGAAARWVEQHGLPPLARGV